LERKSVDPIEKQRSVFVGILLPCFNPSTGGANLARKPELKVFWDGVKDTAHIKPEWWSLPTNVSDTLLAICVLNQVFSSLKDEWEMIYKKAVAYVRGQLGQPGLSLGDFTLETDIVQKMCRAWGL
jgi:hypothetical protein